MKNFFIKWYGLDLSKGKSGLGPNSWGWFRILIPYQKLFYPEACDHDQGYTRGYRECDKIIYDGRFEYGMSMKSKTKIQEFFGKSYFKIVRNFGHLYFNYK